MFASDERGTGLKTQLVAITHAQVKIEFLSPWLTKLHFETGIFERVWLHMRFYPNI